MNLKYNCNGVAPCQKNKFTFSCTLYYEISVVNYRRLTFPHEQAHSHWTGPATREDKKVTGKWCSGELGMEGMMSGNLNN